MTYEQATAYLNALIDYEKAPDFQYAIAFKLERVVALMAELGNPERSWPALHIAGTKGKGSVAAYLDALLRAHGRHTGLYTSPHLVSFRERIRMDGAKISETMFAEIMTRLEPWATRWQKAHDEDRLSFFDVLTAVGFEAFRRARIEWGVVEVGMGGRLDATNVVHPRAVVITPIALEHTKYLGPTVAAIAGEKAGIIKPGVPVVIGRQPDDAARVLAAKCAECGIVPTWLGKDIEIDGAGETWTLRVNDAEYPGLRMGMSAAHQRWNFAAAVAALGKAGVPLHADAVRRVAAETIVPGRLQAFDAKPPLLLDVAHTPDSANRLVEAMRERFPGRQATLVFGCSRDKRVDELAAVLAPSAKVVVLAQMPGIRSMPMEEMLPPWKARHENVLTASSTAKAMTIAKDTTPPEGLIVVCGSFILVGAVMELIGYEPG